MDDIELPPLPEPAVLHVTSGEQVWFTPVTVRGYTAVQVREAQRAAIAADRAKREIPSPQPAPEDITDAMLRAGLQAWQDHADFESRVALSRMYNAMRLAAPAATQPTVKESLTVDDIWRSDEIMSVNARLGLQMPDLLALVRAIESTAAKKGST